MEQETLIRIDHSHRANVKWNHVTRKIKEDIQKKMDEVTTEFGKTIADPIESAKLQSAYQAYEYTVKYIEALERVLDKSTRIDNHTSSE